MSVSLWCEEDQAGSRSSVRASFDPNVTGLRVIERLLQCEERYTPSPLYVSLVQREPKRREELAKWTLEVCCDCGCDEAVFPLAVSLLDRYLSCTLSLPVSPTCLAAACVLVASKLTESETVTAHALCASADYDFLSSELLEMERVLLGTLRWDVAGVTPQDFIPRFLCCLEELMGEGEDTADFISTLRRHGDTLAAMCMCDSRFLGTRPSLVGAAALNAALRGLDFKRRQGTSHMTCTLATLCHSDPAVLQCYSELIDEALRERLRTSREEENGEEEKDGRMEEEEEEKERSSTPTDLREIDF